MRRIVLATGNKGKIRDFGALLSSVDLDPVPIGELAPGFAVPETGTTFLENAVIKARAAREQTGLAALADDSGLAVDVLGGAPGVYSARYAGGDADDAKNNAKLLAALERVPDTQRTACFCCALALVLEDGTLYTAEGRVSGLVRSEPRGSGGFGYDPLFWIPELGQTMAELSLEEKNRISHRARAMARMEGILVSLAGPDPG